MTFSTNDFHKSRLAYAETNYIKLDMRFDIENSNISLSIYKEFQNLIESTSVWLPIMDIDESLFEVIE